MPRQSPRSAARSPATFRPSPPTRTPTGEGAGPAPHRAPAALPRHPRARETLSERRRRRPPAGSPPLRGLRPRPAPPRREPRTAEPHPPAAGPGPPRAAHGPGPPSRQRPRRSEGPPRKRARRCHGEGNPLSTAGAARSLLITIIHFVQALPPRLCTDKCSLKYKDKCVRGASAKEPSLGLRLGLLRGGQRQNGRRRCSKPPRNLPLGGGMRTLEGRKTRNSMEKANFLLHTPK